MFGFVRKWVARRQQRKAVLRAAKEIVESKGGGEAAQLWAASVMDALVSRRPICSSCFNPFDYHERPQDQNFAVRSILMVPDSAPTPMMCDGCFDVAVQSYNRHATNVGTRNDGHANLVLAKFH